MKLKATSKIEINRNSIQKATYSSPLFTQVSHAGNTTGKTAGKTGGYHPSTTPSSPQYRNQNLTQQEKRICNHVRKLINNNFHPYHSLFVTATFADSNKTDLVECNKEFQKFLTKIKRNYNDFAYVAVVSFQERGVPHYHMICNLPMASLRCLISWWSHGSLRCERTSGVYGIAHYMVQNLQYNFKNISLPKHYRLHFASKNLNKSIIYREWSSKEIADYYINSARLTGIKASYALKRENYYCGRITYQTYHVLSEADFPLKQTATRKKSVRKRKRKVVEPF
jgi:hypothetical protein